MSEIAVRFYAGEWPGYKPRIIDALAKNRLPFTRCWITARYYGPNDPVEGRKHTVYQMIVACRECAELGIAADAGLRLWPPPDWSNVDEWNFRAQTLANLPSFLKARCAPLCGREPWVHLDIEDYQKYGLQLSRLRLPEFWHETIASINRVVAYPCAGSYGPFAKALGITTMADEPFFFCRELIGQTPREHTKAEMVAAIAKWRKAVEALGGTYMPGTIDQLLRGRYVKAAVEWAQINLEAGVPIDAPWFCFLDDRYGFLSEQWFS